jgi:hypothetical protein
MKVFALIAIITLVFTVSAQAFTDGSPEAEIRIGKVEIRAVNTFRSTGSATLGGPGAGPGQSNYCMDAFTAPTWATTSPSVFSIEQYEFPPTLSYIPHRTVTVNNAGPWPTPLTLAFVWQICGNGVIFPPFPEKTYGTNAPGDGNTIALTLPEAGVWYVTSEFEGIGTGTWDWIWLARYDGVTPIPVLPPGSSGNDTGGGSYYTFALYTGPGDGVGTGEGEGRPWCFRVF